jgi:copper chaperone NosL
MKKSYFIYFIIVTTIFVSCSKEPVPIRFNEDQCAYCQMIISDQRYGTELITTKGKIYKFDSIECLAAYIIEEKKGTNDLQSIWTIDFKYPEKFIDATKAWYLHSDLLKSPMGLNLSSFTEKNAAENAKNVFPGELIRWDEVKSIVKINWIDK